MTILQSGLHYSRRDKLRSLSLSPYDYVVRVSSLLM